MRNWNSDLHPRARDGKFSRIRDAVTVSTRDAGGDIHHVQGHTGRPRIISTAEFDARHPDSKRLYRGVSSPTGAAVSRDGQLGGGDFGKGIYFGTNIGIAQGYMSHKPDGVMLRAALLPGAVIRRPPDRIRYGSSVGLDKWAVDKGVDVVNLGPMMIVRNPAFLEFDVRDYTIDETVALEYAEKGYVLPAKYADAARRLGLRVQIDDH